MLRNPFPTVTTFSKPTTGASKLPKHVFSEGVAQATQSLQITLDVEELQSQTPAWAASRGQHPMGSIPNAEISRRPGKSAWHGVGCEARSRKLIEGTFSWLIPRSFVQQRLPV